MKMKKQYPHYYIYSTVTYIGSSDGRFTFSMALYADADKTTLMQEGTEVQVGENIYVCVEFDSPVALKMIVTSCVATPMPYDEIVDTSTPIWPLIDNG